MIENLLSHLNPDSGQYANLHLADTALHFALMIAGVSLFTWWVVWMCKSKVQHGE